jgi:hypothetical protein
VLPGALIRGSTLMGSQLVGLELVTRLFFLAALLLQPTIAYQGFDCGQGRNQQYHLMQVISLGMCASPGSA